MVLVTAFIAVASVIGLALLSSASLQAAATRNQDLLAQSDGLAESGVNLGLYWVQNLGDSTKTPTAVANLKVGDPAAVLANQSVKNVPGTFDVTVARLSHTRYQVGARGRATSATGTGAAPTVQRALSAQADANYFGFAISATNLTTSGFTIPGGTTVDGDVFSAVPVTVASGATVNGTIYTAPSSSSSSGGSGGGLLGGLLGTVTNVVNAVTDTLGAVVATLVPTPSTVNHYSSNNYTYVANGKEYAGTAEEITSGTLSATSTWTHDPVKNPASVFYHNGTIELVGNVKINGTLVVQGSGAALKLQNAGNAIAQSVGDLPALVVDGNIIYNGANATLDVQGLTYTGGRVTRSASYTGLALNVTGALLFGGTSGSLDPTVTTHIVYDRLRASVPSLVTGGKPAPTNISVVYWNNQPPAK
jgi:hypothetical protein